MGLKIMFLLDLDVLMFLDLPCNNSFHPLYAAVQDGVTFVNITPCHHSMPIGVTSISTASRLAHPYSFAIRFGLCPFNASTKESTMSSIRHDHPTSTEHSGARDHGTSHGGPNPNGRAKKEEVAVLDAKARAKVCMMSGEVNTVTVDIGQSTASSIRISTVFHCGWM